jgi:hypothetical protein
MYDVLTAAVVAPFATRPISAAIEPISSTAAFAALTLPCEINADGPAVKRLTVHFILCAFGGIAVGIAHKAEASASSRVAIRHDGAFRDFTERSECFTQ